MAIKKASTPPVKSVNSSVVNSGPVASQKKEPINQSKIEKVIPIAEVNEVKTELTDNQEAFAQLVNTFTKIANDVKEFNNKLKIYTKEREKQQKIINKEIAKREKARKTPSGFAKPSKISEEMCNFMKLPIGTEQSRTDVTRYINAYVKEKNLYNPVNRRIIIPDDKLLTLLRVTLSDEVTFFQLQRLISPHFPLAKNKQLALDALNSANALKEANAALAKK
jgi:chromatin remodeling complex protein RSC6